VLVIDVALERELRNARAGSFSTPARDNSAIR
jgi:hypothetical protein